MKDIGSALRSQPRPVRQVEHGIESDQRTRSGDAVGLQSSQPLKSLDRSLQGFVIVACRLARYFYIQDPRE
jgi:hypothetical protein